MQTATSLMPILHLHLVSWMPTVSLFLNALKYTAVFAELALGYGGAVGALTAMGAIEMGLSEDELQPLVDSWRNANPRTVLGVPLRVPMIREPLPSSVHPTPRSRTG